MTAKSEAAPLAPEEALARLRQVLQEIGPVAVAVSGGVDSMTLAAVAHRVDASTQMYHAESAAVPPAATARVRAHAAGEGWDLRVIDAGEMDDEDYLANPVDRCYFCKQNLYGSIATLTSQLLVSGTNADDLSDYRPGLKAADENAVRHPFVDAGIDKEAVRGIAALLGFDDLADLPAGPCLSSRVTTGIAIDQRVLPLIDEAERKTWALLGDHIPLKGVRCRIRETGIVIELDTNRNLQSIGEHKAKVIAAVHDLFRDVGEDVPLSAIGIEPYRRGSAFLIESQDVG